MWERIEGYVIALVASLVAIMGVFNMASADIVAAAVLAVLAVMAILLSNTQATLRRIAAKFPSDRGLELRFEYPDFGPEIQQAREILIIAGISTKTSIGLYYSHFSKALQNGLKVRVLCPNPANEALLHQILLASPGRSRISHAKYDIITGIEAVLNLRNQARESGSAELRVIDYLPDFGLILIIPKSGRKKAIVKTMAFQVTNGEYISFTLTEPADSNWVEYFQKQFESYWEASFQPSDDLASE